MSKLCYCERCGEIVLTYTDKIDEKYCSICKNERIPVPEEYLSYITNTTVPILNKALKEEFIEKYIKSSPNFEQQWFERREKIYKQCDIDRQKIKAFQQKSENSYGVTCPYCKATNIKKISATSRVVSVGFLGLASKKIGKQWHCNYCGSDF